MSKFFDIVQILNEYDVRYSNHGIPSGPGDGYSTASDPSIAGNAAQSAPNNQTPIVPSIKPFTDEANHRDQGKILPFPLDNTVFDRLASAHINITELIRLMELAIKNSALTLPERDMLTRNIQMLTPQIKNIQIISTDLELLGKPD